MMCVLVVLLLPSKGSAQWVSESYPLKAGWNAIWLSQDCSDRRIETVLNQNPQIDEIWRWNPLVSTVQYVNSPSNPIKPDSKWAVWRRNDPSNSTLGSLTGNSAYLVSVTPGAASFTLDLVGKPLPPNYNFSSSGLNFIGFPAQSPDSSAQRNFDTFFSFSAVLKSHPDVFVYRGGALSTDNPQNPYKVATPRFTAVSRGKAYWVNSDQYSDYYGPLKVTVLGAGGIHFGRKLNHVTVRVENVTDPEKNQTVTANFNLIASAPAPEETTPADLLNLRVRGARDSYLQFTYSGFNDSGNPVELTLAPGESKDLILDANRAEMLEADRAYAAVLQVTDSLGHTRIDLPVSGVGSSAKGVWVGAAVLNSVNRVEALSGPEFSAPLGTPNGAVAGESTREEVFIETGGGQTTQTRRYHVSFDSNGFADLREAEMNPSNITVKVITDEDTTPDYVQGVDFSVVSSVFGTVTDPGSGYTVAPTVKFTGVKDVDFATSVTAQATLSARVKKVTMTNGGSGYKNQSLDVIFTGGDGDDAEGYVTVEAGVVTGVVITNGGLGYTSAPAMEFPVPFGAGGVAAIGIATLTGDVVTGVNMSAGGSGYLDLIEVSFTGDAKSDAEGFAVVSNEGLITDIFVTNQGSGYTAPPRIQITGGEGIGATATAEISGGVGRITILDPGAGYKQAPVVSFESVDENGSGATATVNLTQAGTISGVDRIQKLDLENGPIGSRAQVSYSESATAAPGTPDGSATSIVLSTREVVTLNGKSHVVTRRVSSGADATAPSNLPIRLVFHAPESEGPPTLLQQIYLGQRDGVEYAGPDEAAMAEVITSPGDTEPGQLARSSSASFPLGGKWIADSGSWGSGSLRFDVLLGFNHSSNPFVHAYHPDHDNWDARYEKPLKNKQESYTVNREIILHFSPTPLAGVSDLGWGMTTLGGTYTETFTGLRTQQISVSGEFIIHQVSEAASLTE